MRVLLQPSPPTMGIIDPHWKDRISTDWHFPVLIGASFVAFVGVLLAALRRLADRPPVSTYLWVATIVVVGGMTFARSGALGGLPIWV